MKQKCLSLIVLKRFSRLVEVILEEFFKKQFWFLPKVSQYSFANDCSVKQKR